MRRYFYLGVARYFTQGDIFDAKSQTITSQDNQRDIESDDYTNQTNEPINIKNLGVVNGVASV